MTTTTDRRAALAEQIFTSMLGALEIFHVYVGDRLGLYSTLAASGEVTADEFAAAANINPRYAREWLEQQAVSGVIDVSDDRRYALSAEAEEVLCNPDSDFQMAAGAQLIAGVAAALPKVVEAFRTGAAVPYADYGADVRVGIARLNRPMFVNHLVSEWIPAMPDIDERLRNGGWAADLGCGTGCSTLSLARGYPQAHVDGLDLDEASIAEAAAALAAEPDLADRVTFICRDAAGPSFAGRYDVVTFFETLHDMAHPVAALSAAREMLTDGGAVLVGDEKVAEKFAAPGDELERFNYGWSALHCLAAAMGEPGTAATGTVIRPSTVRKYAQEAGFSQVDILPIEHDFWRFYRLIP
ncbi:class I SAM-dependent methyltransferase [Smaragdicoccus niigatensis]|uniref:class I SAM-dependent methyltransferase n=1 Tax=Smaragdicoccus niigatensis TaxID=359359 RepID=UPI000366185D|nr:class I SAM-dependent methyltransferase [Smaragdicoccus niigatensis]